MYLFCVDFSKNNLLTEQLNVRSFYDLPVMDKSLLYYQLTIFSGLSLTKTYLFDNEKKFDFSTFKTENIKFDLWGKLLFELSEKESVILFRNDVYFEKDISQYVKSDFYNNILSFTDKNGVGVCAVTSVGYLRKLYSRNVSIVDVLQNGEKFTDINITLDCYTKLFTTVKSYKSFLFDILNDKVAIKPPRIAEGVFVKESVPKGDFSIVPPVYFGNMVQIEEGSVIGPNTIVYNNSLISSHSVIKNSIFFDNVYVSANCYIEGAVCCENSSIKRNSAVFSGTIIGENALIGEDMIVEPCSIIKKNVKFDSMVKSPFTNKINSSYNNKFQGLSPDKAALLGSAVATVFGKPKIIIASDGSSNSSAIKLALLSGLVASGAECIDMGIIFKTQLFFGLAYCECDFSLFVTGRETGTDIEIFNCNNEPISKADCCNLLDYCNKKEFVYVSGPECKNVRQIQGLKKMYVREITSVFNCDLSVIPVITCQNPMISNIIEKIFDKIDSRKCKKDENINININDVGSKILLQYKNKEVNEKTLIKLVHHYTEKNDNFTELQNIYYKKLFEKDSLFLIMCVLYIVEKTKKDIGELISSLPDFFICSKTFDCEMKTSHIADKISSFDNCFFKKGFFNIPLKKGIIKLRKNSKIDKIKVFCATDNMSVSEALCDFFGGYIVPTDA